MILLILYLLTPLKSGEFIAEGEYGTAKVKYDEFGVPHVLADNRMIGSYGLGYVQAKDRLWQMDSLRRIAYGRLSEVFGSMTYGVDETMRLFNLKSQCEIIINKMEKEPYSFLLAYTKGVNKFVEENPLPFNFQLFWINFDPWTPIDVCSVMKFMHLGLNQNWGYEIIRDYLSAVSGDDDLAESLYSYEYDFFKNHTIPIISDDELKAHNLFRDNTGEEKPSGFRVSDIKDYFKAISQTIKVLGGSSTHGGSNSWVISGEHTKSGRSLFVNDPHLKNTLPPTWYLSHIEYRDGSYIAGANIPGVPLHSVFSTNTLAGGVTAIFSDNSDIYEEKIKNNTYLFEGEYRPLEFREEIIKVRGGEDRKYTVRSTHHGPIISKHSFMMNQIIPMFPLLLPEGEFSIRWTGMDPYLENTLEYAYYGQLANTTQEALDL